MTDPDCIDAFRNKLNLL
uniref:Uncharacterized protein n=1 Tax=Strongyloides venezuelensis TaxID=75913 RepID=A0A0K0FTG9_STRVS